MRIQINDSGLAALRRFLADTTKNGDTLTTDMVHAWASEAECCWRHGQIPQVEVSRAYHRRGQVEVFTFATNQYDVVEEV